MNIRSPYLSITARLAAILAILLAAGLFSACSSKPKPTKAEVAVEKLDDLKTKVSEIVKDETRAATVVAVVEKMQELVKVQGQALAAHDERIYALLAAYGTTDEQLRNEFASFSADRNERTTRAIELAQQLRAATTPEEWSALDRVRTKALKSAIGAVRQE